MTDPTAFLAATLAHPADDGVRLVYADWLEERGENHAAGEQRLRVAMRSVLARPDDDAPRLNYAGICETHGQPGRGEFIRVQVELASMEGKAVPVVAHDDLYIKHTARKLILRRRERELYAALHPRIWGELQHLPIFSPAQGDLVSAFRRGFVKEIACDWPTWGGGPCRECEGLGYENGRVNLRRCRLCSGTGRTPGHAAAILAAQPVRKVRLTTMPQLSDIELVRGDLFWRAKLRAGRVWVPLAADSGLNVPLLYIVDLLLAAEVKPTGRWPGLEFELPAADGVSPLEAARFWQREQERLDQFIIDGDPGVQQPLGILSSLTAPRPTRYTV